jgi:hypothetical protein
MIVGHKDPSPTDLLDRAEPFNKHFGLKDLPFLFGMDFLSNIDHFLFGCSIFCLDVHGIEWNETTFHGSDMLLEYLITFGVGVE